MTVFLDALQSLWLCAHIWQSLESSPCISMWDKNYGLILGQDIWFRLNLDRHLRIKISEKSLTPHFDVAMTLFSSDKSIWILIFSLENDVMATLKRCGKLFSLIFILKCQDIFLGILNGSYNMFEINRFLLLCCFVSTAVSKLCVYSPANCIWSWLNVTQGRIQELKKEGA